MRSQIAGKDGLARTWRTENAQELTRAQIVMDKPLLARLRFDVSVEGEA
jgi:hypothetical protein